MKTDNYKSTLKDRRKELRNNMTTAEILLWQRLRKKQIENKRFRRQHPVGRYIVDFFCVSEQLVIEVDGSIHETTWQEEYDIERDKYLNSQGYRVLRITNDQVYQGIENVVEIIRRVIREGSPG